MSLSKSFVRAKYHSHKYCAKARGIEFLLTFEEWLSIWGDKIEQRGVRSWQLGMCRINDSGPYAVGNVYLGTPARNGASRRMAYENSRGKESKYVFQAAPAREYIVGDEPDDEYIERRMGVKTSGIWG
jgi:hypothetical protein